MSGQMAAALMIAVALTASTGCPPTPPEQPPPISMNPDWLVKPDYKDIYWAFPPRAVAERREGRATISCEVSVQGVAEACRAVSEEPEGYGFGEAAIALTSKMLFKPRLECGKVVPGTIRIPIAFKLPPDNEALTPEPLDPKDKKLALAARLVATLRIVDHFQEMVDDSAWAVIQMVETEREITAEEREVLHDAARTTWAGASARVINAMARSFASRMTEDELTKALQFYEGPVGAKMISLDEAFSDDLGSLFEALEPEMILEFHRRYCEKMQDLCAPDDAT